jgi:hypothetical protein
MTNTAKDTIAAVALIALLGFLCYSAVQAWDKESAAHEHRIALIVETMGRCCNEH